MKTSTIEFVVYGKPQQRGSKRAIPFKRNNGKLGVAVADDNKRSKDWMQQVASAAAEAHDGELIEGAVRLTATFFFTRPKSHFGTGRNSEVVKESAPLLHTNIPDLSKLVRAVEDALTQVVYRDDRQICEERISKRWTVGPSCVRVVVEALESP